MLQCVCHDSVCIGPGIVRDQNVWVTVIIIMGTMSRVRSSLSASVV